MIEENYIINKRQTNLFLGLLTFATGIIGFVRERDSTIFLIICFVVFFIGSALISFSIFPNKSGRNTK